MAADPSDPSGTLQVALSVAPSPEPSDDVTVVAIVPVPIRRGPRGGITHYAVPCGDCGTMFEIAARTFRDLRAQERVPCCGVCRRPVSIVVTEEHARWWADRYGREDIRVMGWAIGGIAETTFGFSPSELPQRGDLALVASALRP